MKCIREIKTMSAKFSTELDQEKYTHKAIGTQFFNMFRNPELYNHYNYLFYMEPDTVPIRALWMDRIYEEVEFVEDFWVKGSIYRGK